MNKKILAMLAIMALSLSHSAMSEEKERTFAVSANPVSAIFGSFRGLFQYKLTDYMSLTVPVSAGTNWLVGPQTSWLLNDKYDSSLWFAGGGLGLRFHFKNQGLANGLFLEPRAMFSQSKFHLLQNNDPAMEAKFSSLLTTLVFGHEWLLDSGLFFSTSVELGLATHLAKELKVEPALASKLENNRLAKNILWAEDGRVHLHHSFDFSIGYAW
jgi:hypothetical protein